MKPRDLIASKKFYGSLLRLMIPIMIQNGITNFVNMLDNVMVGRVGTVEMTGVSVANQLMFVFNLCMFGAVSGAGIFGAQFFGKQDHDGVRYTFRFKVISCLGLTLAAMAAFWFFGKNLCRLYLLGDGDVTDIEKSLACGVDYLRLMLIGMIPYALVQCYSSTLRECGKPTVPMFAGLAAVTVNLCLNYVLIFGHFGLPAMGVRGAAIATVISRFTELAIVALWTERHKIDNPFIVGAYSSLRIPGKLTREIIRKGLPLMLNETLWSVGTVALTQCYSRCGYNVVAANNISDTFFNVFSVAFMAVGVSIGIVLGQMLGAGETEKAPQAAWQMITFSVFVSIVVALVYAVAALWVPNIYNTTDEIRLLATRLMQISALAMPLDAFANAAYFTLRSGGQVMITLLFDSVFALFVRFPLVWLVFELFKPDILPLFAFAQVLLILKFLLGFIFVKKKIWVRNIVAED